MTDVTLKDVASGFNQKTTINDNNSTIETGFANSVSKVAGSDNQMATNLDMNSNRVTNLLDGVQNQDAATVAQLSNLTTVATTALTANNVGAVIYPKTAAETSAGIYEVGDGSYTATKGNIVSPWYAPGDVRRYGADQSGDDSAAFQAALSQNEEALGDTVTSPQGTFQIDTGLTWLTGLQQWEDHCWESNGTKLTTANNIDMITIGPPSGSNEVLHLTILGHLYLSCTYTAGSKTGYGFSQYVRHAGEYIRSLPRINS